MARRRGKNSSGSVVNIKSKALATLFIVLIMVGSFLLFVAWAYFESKLRKLFKPESIHDFDNSPEEVSELNKIEKECQIASSRRNDIYKEGQSLKTKQDGTFDERSKKGKELNRELEGLLPRIEELDKRADEIASRPGKRLDNWAFYATMPIALRYACSIYAIVFAACAWLQPKWVMQLSYTLKNLSFLDFYSSYPVAYGASVGALVISSLVLLISYFWICEVKKDELKNKVLTKHAKTQSSEDKVNVKPRKPSTKKLMKLSHSELKELVVKHNIDADKRSKSSILDAIKNQDAEVIKHIVASI